MKTGIRRGLRTALAGSLLFGGTVVASVIAGSLPASATTTVASVAVGGSDTGSCQTAGSPCATISYAYMQTSSATSSTTIDVGLGVFPVDLCVCSAPGGGYPYTDNVTIQGSSSGAAPVTTLDGQATAARGQITLENLTVNGESGVAVSSGYAGTIQIVDSTVTNSNPALTETGPESGFPSRTPRSRATRWRWTSRTARTRSPPGEHRRRQRNRTGRRSGKGR